MSCTNANVSRLLGFAHAEEWEIDVKNFQEDRIHVNAARRPGTSQGRLGHSIDGHRPQMNSGHIGLGSSC